MSRKSERQKKRKRLEDKKKRRRIREVRRKRQPRQSAIILKQEQEAAMRARRIARDLDSFFSPKALMEGLGIPETDRIKLE